MYKKENQPLKRREKIFEKNTETPKKTVYTFTYHLRKKSGTL